MLCCLVGLIVVAPSAVQGDAQSVRFSRPAGLASVVLSELSTETKAKLVAAPSVARDVLYLNLRGVTLEEAKERIASTMHAEWRLEKDGTYLLDRSKATQSADERDEAIRNAARLKKGIDATVAKYANQPAWSTEAARRLAKTYIDAQQEYFASGNDAAMASASTKMTGMAPELPGGRALIKLLPMLSQSQLERMSMSRTVFSTRPTRMQVGMPNGADSVIRQLVADMKVLDRAMKDAEGSRDRSRVFVTGTISPMEFEGENIDDISVSILRSSSYSNSSETSFQLTVADSKGETITTAQLAIPVPPATTNGNFPVGPDEKPIELSDLAAKYGRALRSAGSSLSTSMLGPVAGGPEIIVVTQNAGGGEATPDLLAQIINPDKYEPMRLAPTEGLDAVANQLDRNVVAYIPDSSLVQINNALLAGKAKPSELLTQLQSSCGMLVDSDGAWLRLSPASPAAARRQQVNRVALAKTLNLLVSQGYLTLNDLGAYATQQETGPAYSRWDRSCFMAVNASCADQYFGYQNPWWLLKLYGMMSPSQRQSLFASQQVPLANLTPPQLELLGTEVFRGGYGVKVEREEKPRVGAGVWYPSLLDEVTYVLPNGVTREGFIQVKTVNQPAVQTMSSQTGAVSFLPLGGLAWRRLNADRPDLTSAYGAAGRADKYRMATQANHEFQFQFAQNVSMTAKLADLTTSNESQFGAYESLPSDFRAMVDEAATRLKDMATEMSSRRTGAKPPQ